jgi:hypothetical protein
MQSSPTQELTDLADSGFIVYMLILQPGVGAIDFLGDFNVAKCNAALPEYSH